MGKSVRAIITPEVLLWARKSAGLSREEVAATANLDPAQILEWEDGISTPTVAQMRKIASIYRRPLALFYLPQPPGNFQPMHDFRRLPEAGSGNYSAPLLYEMRLAHERRELALELYEVQGTRPPSFDIAARLTENPDEVGMRIRERLAVTQSLQSTWRDNRIAFHAWRARIEDVGALVFQAARVESEEASGFAFAADVLPFMVVNRKDAWGRRVFSLMHELAHLMLHSSGVSNLRTIPAVMASDQRVEVYCNQVAAAALMPKLTFLGEHLLADAEPASEEWSDEAISELARHYSVSREAVVRRLLTFGLTTEAFYGRKRQQYLQEYVATKRRQRESQDGRKIARNMPRETLHDAGRPLIGMIFEQYQARELTLSEVSGRLGIRTKHVEALERQLLERA